MSHDWSPLPLHTLKELSRWFDWAEHHAELRIKCCADQETANLSQWRWALKDLSAAQREIRDEVIKRNS